jgi:hypothetical protein
VLYDRVTVVNVLRGGFSAIGSLVHFLHVCFLSHFCLIVDVFVDEKVEAATSADATLPSHI